MSEIENNRKEYAKLKRELEYRYANTSNKDYLIMRRILSFASAAYQGFYENKNRLDNIEKILKDKGLIEGT